MLKSRWSPWASWFLVIFVTAAALRIALAIRPGLWVDEVFSLAIATGHSLEHPAADADSAYGDYIEALGAQPAAAWQAYMQHDPAPASPSRVVRAVYLSDTNPPLYYLLLSQWLRLTGSSDAALRLFSTAAALACFPLLWLVGRQTGGRRTAVAAAALFAFTPPAVYYSAEGRMYSLTWLAGLGLAAASYQLARRGARPRWMLLWIVAGAAALLTHYFLAFVWLACAAWLILHPGRSRRSVIAIAAALSLAAVLPWYLHVPESIARWRVTAGWLDVPLSVGEAIKAPADLAWSMFAVRGIWGGSKLANRLTALAFAGVALLVLRRGIKPLFSPRRQLLWLWLGASVLGVITFDLLRGTNAALISRYALPGLPAAALLGGIALGRLPRRAAVAAALLVVIGWSAAIRDMFVRPARWWQPFPELAAELDSSTSPADVVIIHSIPSGVLGVARYLPGEVPVASWVQRLEQRQVPGDIERLAAAACRVVLVKVHDLGTASTAEAWLRAHATLLTEDRSVTHSEILYFQPSSSGDIPERRCPD